MSREASADAGSSKHRKRVNGHCEKLYIYIFEIISKPELEHFASVMNTNLAMELRDPVALGLVKAHRGPHALVATVVTACPTCKGEKAWHLKKKKKIHSCLQLTVWNATTFFSIDVPIIIFWDELVDC